MLTLYKMVVIFKIRRIFHAYEKLKSIVAYPDRVLEFVFNDGRKKSIPWELKSRRFSWNDEAREKARNNALKRYENKNSKK